jgi:hypothetical protein
MINEQTHKILVEIVKHIELSVDKKDLTLLQMTILLLNDLRTRIGKIEGMVEARYRDEFEELLK